MLSGFFVRWILYRVESWIEGRKNVSTLPLKLYPMSKCGIKLKNCKLRYYNIQIVKYESSEKTILKKT